MKTIVLLLLLCLMLAGCSAGVKVTREQFGEAWPLTVDSGTVDCVDGLAAVFRHGGTTYALTGFAQSRGYTPIDPIWRDDPVYPDLKVNISPLIKLALQQCKGYPLGEE